MKPDSTLYIGTCFFLVNDVVIDIFSPQWIQLYFIFG